MAGSKCKSGCIWFWETFSSAVFEYDTAKIVHIKSKKVGLMNRFIQLIIIGYIIGYSVLWEKGYQKTGPVQSAVTTKLKGAWLFNGTQDYTQNCSEAGSPGDGVVFDVGDYVIPPQEPNGFFVMTNVWKTCNQSQDRCAEAADVHGSDCTENDTSNCLPIGMVFVGGNGPTTGECSTDVGRCQIVGWCPSENENKTISMREPVINATNFTVLIKNSIEFPTIKAGVRKRNILPDANSTFLQTCTFNESTMEELYCPILSLGQIVGMIEPAEDFRNLSLQGGVVGLEITWDCNHLEFGLDKCHPKYTAKRLDDPNAKISKGFNFRYAKYYYVDGDEHRDLIKAYGILFKIQVSGTGGIFDFVTLVLKIGSTIALLAVATVASDIIVLYVLQKRYFYRDKKYLNVEDPHDGYEVLDGEDRNVRKRIVNPAGSGSQDST